MNPMTISKTHSSASSEAAVQSVIDLISGFHASWIIYLGQRLGMLPEVRRNPGGIGSESLAGRLGLLPDAVRLWCDMAYAFGILEFQDGIYYLAPGLDEVLVDESSPRYYGAHFPYIVAASQDFDKLIEYFHSGAVIDQRSGDYLRSLAALTRIDIEAFRHRFLPHAPEVVRAWQHGARVLEVGCGTGHWLVEMAREFPRCIFTGIDVDENALTIARGRIHFEKLEDRVSVRRLEVLAMDYLEAFDSVYLQEVLLCLPEKAEALRRIRGALTPQGIAIALEWVVPEERSAYRSPEARLLWGSQLGEMVTGTRFMTRQEIHDAFAAGGFENIQQLSLNHGAVVTVARK